MLDPTRPRLTYLRFSILGALGLKNTNITSFCVVRHKISTGRVVQIFPIDVSTP
jgi:hypothetical protein